MLKIIYFPHKGYSWTDFGIILDSKGRSVHIGTLPQRVQTGLWIILDFRKVCAIKIGHFPQRVWTDFDIILNFRKVYAYSGHFPQKV